MNIHKKLTLCTYVVFGLALQSCSDSNYPQSTSSNQKNESGGVTKNKPAALSLRSLTYNDVRGAAKAVLMPAEIDALKQIFQTSNGGVSLNVLGQRIDDRGYGYGWANEDDSDERLSSFGNIKTLIQSLKQLSDGARSEMNTIHTHVEEPVYERRLCFSSWRKDAAELTGQAFVQGKVVRSLKKESVVDANTPSSPLETVVFDANADLVGSAVNCKHAPGYQTFMKMFPSGLELETFPTFSFPEDPVPGAADYAEKRAAFERAEKAARDRMNEIVEKNRAVGLARESFMNQNSYAVDGEVAVRSEVHIEMQGVREQRLLDAKHFRGKLVGTKGFGKSWSTVSGKASSMGFDENSLNMKKSEFEFRDFAIQVSMSRDQAYTLPTVGINDLFSEEVNRTDLEDYLSDMVSCSGSVAINGQSYSCESIALVLISELVKERSVNIPHKAVELRRHDEEDSPLE